MYIKSGFQTSLVTMVEGKTLFLRRRKRYLNKVKLLFFSEVSNNFQS